MSILTLLETKDGQIKKGSLSAVTCARRIADKTGFSYDIILGGEPSEKAIEEASELGARTVYVVKGLKEYTAENYKIAIEKVMNESGASYFVAVGSAVGKDLAPRLAARLGAGMGSEIIEVIDGETFKRLMYAGNIIATIKIKTPKKVLTARGVAFERAGKTGGKSEVKFVESPGRFEKKRFIKFDEIKSTRPELTEAQVIVSVGRGIRDAENLKIAEELADVLGAAIGATRAVVDAGWLPNDYQIGQTGKTVAPQLYIGIGMSGAIQHVAGMKDSKVIVAINKDPEAPIFQIADIGLVADLFQVVPQLTQKLKKLKEQSG